ncbi:NADP-dependent oxidoreductase domain-containing protein 1-like [Patiria miniata]|uniref:Pyrroline-5-carboxylate reductase catalytic N-terminal domain-containing protein n=1 Tax=Patiria miniata TaxID=46514 RepID=A0A914BCE9_PATMI|nr:NADP-dependent oxidoreductase domain-containing protein 1-like [Patiria miniata]
MASVEIGNSIGDITRDLPSLKFENAISEEEAQYLVLRTRSHAITVSACAQATYFAAVLNEARQHILELRSPQQSKTSKFLQDAPPRDPLLVGIIGCGRIGLHLANALLTYADVQPKELFVSTRRPETLGTLKDRGVSCVYNNAKVATSVHLLFLCVLPSQLPDIADDIKGIVPAHCTVYTFLSSVPIPRLRQVIKCSSLIKPEFSLPPDKADKPWDCSKDVCTTLENSQQVQATCPLSLDKEDAILSTDDKWAEMVLYSFVNLCIRLGLSREETLSTLNCVVLGQAVSREYTSKFAAENFTKRKDIFPIFDLAAVAANPTPLTRVITEDEEIRRQFVKKYKSTFDKFYYWKGIKQVKKKPDGD